MDLCSLCFFLKQGNKLLTKNMKKLDYILRNWRYSMVEPFIPEDCEILDIGGYDGSFLLRIKNKIKKGYCIDPLIQPFKDDKLEFIKKKISKKFPFPDSSFDVITLLAVFEHLGKERIIFVEEIFRLLKEEGIVVLTVPDKFVDSILKLLSILNLIDGMSIEEHDKYNVSGTPDIFTKKGFVLKKWKKFQLGLNNLFIFKKKSGDNILV